jgi:hypothetical protein
MSESAGKAAQSLSTAHGQRLGCMPGPFTPGVEKRQNSDPFQAGKRKSAGLFFWRFCATR